MYAFTFFSLAALKIAYNLIETEREIDRLVSYEIAEV